AHRDLHSFPTRRSSDLRNNRAAWKFPVSSGAGLSDIASPSCSGFPAYAADRFCPVFANAVVIAVQKTAFAGQYARSETGFFAGPDRKSTRLNSSHVKIS